VGVHFSWRRRPLWSEVPSGGMVEHVPSCDVSDNRAKSMREGSPLGLLWVGVWTTCESEKLYKNPFSLEKSGWDGLQKSTLKSPINTKLEKLKGLIWCTTVKRVSKMATGEDGGL